jgi:hypothetical protein
MRHGRGKHASDDDHPDDHHDHDRIVPVEILPSRMEADIVAAALESRGIKVTVDHGDASGWDPMLSLLQGHRVLVFESDLEVARAILAERD